MDSDEDLILLNYWVRDGQTIDTVKNFHFRFLIANSIEEFTERILEVQQRIGSTALNPYFKLDEFKRMHYVPLNRVGVDTHYRLGKEVSTAEEALFKWKFERLQKWNVCRVRRPLCNWKDCHLSYWEWRLISFFIAN